MTPVEAPNQNEPDSYSWDLLKTVDPDRASKVHKNDQYRINRALDMYYCYGIKPSTIKNSFSPPGAMHILHITREKYELDELVKQRTQQMFEQGLENEVESLIKSGWEDFLIQKKLIGYDDIIDALKIRSNYDQEWVMKKIIQRTIDYQKRQKVFWKMLEKKLSNEKNETQKPVTWEEWNLTFADLDLYLNQLKQSIHNS